MTHFLLCFATGMVLLGAMLPRDNHLHWYEPMTFCLPACIQVKAHPSQKIKYKKQEWLNKSEYSVSICQMHFLLLFSRQGKLRLQKWFLPLPERERKKIIKDMTAMVLARKPRTCNFLHWRDLKIVYKRWALNPDLITFNHWNETTVHMGSVFGKTVWRRLF